MPESGRLSKVRFANLDELRCFEVSEGRGDQVKVLVGGSHGMIGEALVERLQELGHEPIRLARTNTSEGIFWNPIVGQIDPREIEGIDAVVHLGGESIGEKRWTERVRERLWNSRINTTELLATTLASLTYKPETFICASAIGYYGSRGDEPLTEESDKGEGFLSDLCATWEDATTPAREAGIRVVNLRSGVILSDRGGSLPRQVPLFKSWVGGKLGRGDQWLSWISLRDEVEAIVHILTHAELRGAVNLTSPNPVTNLEFTYALQVALHRIAAIPTPRWMLKLVLGADLTDQLVLASQCVYPTKLTESGFEFRDPDIHEYLKELFEPREEEPDTNDGPDEITDDESSGPGFAR